MSTRSCTTLYEGEHKNPHGTGARLVSLYRHHDGYPALAGACLLDALRASKNATDALAMLLSHSYQATSYRPSVRMYELTTDAEDHGDLEHRYSAWHDGKGWHVRHEKRQTWTMDTWSRDEYTLAEFVACVNADRAGINLRLEEMRAKYPNEYKDAEGYPMCAEVLP